ncbi:zinc-dependent alcohol dehydrogenase family protein [Ascidiaceihabitans sp.]|uniref:zinc-dependent alcohol dehydrogenase family protein n=1 Tax=Ascidiaceihabitans sp. TaxID=1872644 RepID=UPI00329960D8
MKKVVYEEFGDPVAVLQVVEAESQPLEVGQARVEVLRAPINPSDLIQIAGNYGVRPPLPAVAGNEGIGRVTEVNGAGVEVGQLVLVPAGAGTWVTEIVAGIHQLVPMPEGDVDQLCMMMVNPATAQLLLTEYVDLKPGDWIIQSAANSAVGGYIVQLAKARGVNVVNVVRRDSAVEDVKALGGDVVLVDGPDLAAEVKKATGAKMKLAIDAVAGATAGRLADTLERGGTLVNYGGMSNEPSALGAAALIFNDIVVRGFWLVLWFEKASRDERMAVYGALTAAVAKGELHAPIDKVFTLEEVTEAARYSWAGSRKGKVLMAPNGI